jgi:hypothetical protein
MRYAPSTRLRPRQPMKLVKAGVNQSGDLTRRNRLGAFAVGLLALSDAAS